MTIVYSKGVSLLTNMLGETIQKQSKAPEAMEAWGGGDPTCLALNNRIRLETLDLISKRLISSGNDLFDLRNVYFIRGPF